MGKSEDQMKKKTKEVQKSPISPFWMREYPFSPLTGPRGLISWAVLLAFIIFGGLVFEAMSRFFG